MLLWTTGGASVSYTHLFAGYLDAQDWADHPITVHNSVGAVEAVYGGLGGDRLFSATAMQYAAEEAGRLVESWRATSAAAGRPWIIDMDENNPAGVGLTPDNAGQLRKAIPVSYTHLDVYKRQPFICMHL